MGEDAADSDRSDSQGPTSLRSAGPWESHGVIVTGIPVMGPLDLVGTDPPPPAIGQRAYITEVLREMCTKSATS